MRSQSAAIMHVAATFGMATLALATLCVVAGNANACPFCVPVQQTFRQEIEAADAVAIAQLRHAPPTDTSGEGKLEKSRFEVVEFIKGEKHLAADASGKKSIELLYFGPGKQGDRFLMIAVDPPKLAWSTPTLLDERKEKYLRAVVSLPAAGPDRMAFFQQFLEDKDDLLARDAYDEFARIPYDGLIAMKEKMNHDQLIAWIKDTNIPASRRRLYLTMLGVCGNRADADMLEGMLRSDERKLKSGLDAMIACYLRLRGADGLPLVENLYLKDKKSEYADTYSAIMALRFHGDQTDVIPRATITKSLHHMLDRPELADLVIVDLARWEDWSVMDRLVELFKNADDKSSWVRVPVVRYLMACPKDEAKKHLKELEKIDAGAVRRAKTFFPFQDNKTQKATSAAEPASAPANSIALAARPVVHLANGAPAALRALDSPRDASQQPASAAQPAMPRDFSNLYATGGVLIAAAAVAAVYGLAQHFSKPPAPASSGAAGK